MKRSFDVMVVGAGPVGSACAFSLAAAGVDVALIDGDSQPGAAWRASAGMLAAQVETQPGDLLYPLALAGREYYYRAVPDLAMRTGIDPRLRRTGMLQLAFDQADAAHLAELARQQQAGGQRAQLLDRDEARREWPWIGDIAGGCWFPDDGDIDPVLLVMALRRSAAQAGAMLMPRDVDEVVLRNGSVHALRVGEDTLHAPSVVIASGAWSATLAGAERRVAVEPVRGQMAAFAWPRERAPAIVYGRGCYILERRGELLAGATMEHVGFDARNTYDGISGLQHRVAGIDPMLRTMTPLRRWAGLRPGTPDGLPIVGRDPNIRGLWYATGHGRNGILLAGITGEWIRDAVMHNRRDPLIAPLDPARLVSAGLP